MLIAAKQDKIYQSLPADACAKMDATKRHSTHVPEVKPQQQEDTKTDQVKKPDQTKPAEKPKDPMKSNALLAAISKSM